MKKRFFIILVLLITFLFILRLERVSAQESCDSGCNSGDLGCLGKLVDLCGNKVAQLHGQANTLSNQIASFNAQIRLMELKIQQTKEQIKLLGGRIDQLEVSLQDLTKAFSARAVDTYKMAKTNEQVFLLFSSADLSKMISRFHYLKEIESYDQNLLARLQSAQNTYKTNKQQSEELEKTLQTEEDRLSSQKAAKAQLLVATQNDERKYQQILAQARAELEAIQSIIAGNGDETEVGGIGEGQRIASIIPGASACSSGTHLHFEVVKDGGHQNPAGYLSPKEVIWDDGPDGPFGFSGGWQWPVNDPVRITQGYGMTYYAATLNYYGGNPHTGVDMLNNNQDSTVKAVRNGTLYRGAIGCGGGTLRYVRVKQDSGIDTYYLHVNY